MVNFMVQVLPTIIFFSALTSLFTTWVFYKGGLLFRMDDEKFRNSQALKV